MKGFPLQRSLWVGPLLAALAAFAGLQGCNTETKEDTVSLKIEPEWLGFDRVVFIWMNEDSEIQDTLYNGKLEDLNDFQKIPAKGFGGDRAIFQIEGFENGETVFLQIRRFDIDSPTLITTLYDASIPAETIELSDSTLRIEVGEKRKVSAEISPSASPQKIVWTVSDSSRLILSSVDGSEGEIELQGRRTGEVRVFARAASDSSIRGSLEVTVTGENPPGPRIRDFRYDSLVSIGDTIRFSATLVAGAGELVSWTGDFFSDASVDTLGVLNGEEFDWEYTAVFDDADRYELRFETTNSEGDLASVIASVEVVIDAPQVQAGEDTVAQKDQAILFRGSATQQFGEFAQWKWDFEGDGVWDDSSAEKRDFEHAYDEDGTYNATLLVRDDDGNEGEDVRVMEIGNAPPRILGFSASDSSLFSGDSITLIAEFSDADGIIVSYEIDFDGDGNVDAGGSPMLPRSNSKSVNGMETSASIRSY